MNIKLKRSVRTPHSEEIDIIDGDLRDEHDAPLSIGKLELHYLDDQVVGTLLIWQEFADQYNRNQASGLTMDDLVEQIMSEVTEPIGVSPEYGIEIYFPSVINHSFASHYADEEDEESEDEEEDDEQDESDEELTDPTQQDHPPDDDFYRKLTQRP